MTPPATRTAVTRAAAGTTGAAAMAPTMLQLPDLAGEAVAGLTARPARTALTVLGTVLGISALVATAGISQTAGNRIVGAFDELEATSVVVTNEQSDFGGGTSIAASIPRDAGDRLGRLSGVRAVGTLGEVDTAGALVSAVQLDDPAARDSFDLDVYAASSGLAGACRGRRSRSSLWRPSWPDCWRPTCPPGGRPG